VAKSTFVGSVALEIVEAVVSALSLDKLGAAVLDFAALHAL
jgi:hypothetical protein